MTPAIVASCSEVKLPFTVTELLKKLDVGPEEVVGDEDGTDLLLIMRTYAGFCS
jgi:hypothetical protein